MSKTQNCDMTQNSQKVLFGVCCLCSGDEAFYPTRDTLGVGEHKDSEEGINRMTEDLEKQYV